jgi:hypothetical protein
MLAVLGRHGPRRRHGPPRHSGHDDGHHRRSGPRRSGPRRGGPPLRAPRLRGSGQGSLETVGESDRLFDGLVDPAGADL